MGISEFERFFRRNTSSGFIIDGMNRINIDEYPIKAIREGFINALAHRNYERSSSFIEFYIFDDRIEIISPGKLKYPLTIEDIKNDEGIGIEIRGYVTYSIRPIIWNILVEESLK